MTSNNQTVIEIEFAVATAWALGQLTTPEGREKLFEELRKDPRVEDVSWSAPKINIRLRAEVHKIDVNVLFSKGASDD